MTIERPTILVTGASRGLGRALVRVFARRRCRVFGVIRAADARADLEADGPGPVRGIVGDVTSADFPQRMAAAVARDSGVLDILINNAGSRGYVYSIDKEPEEEVLALLQVHCVGALRAARAALPFLSKSPNPLIVNVTSRFGSITRTAEGALPGGQLSYSYRIAKAAQNMLTLCLHQELHAQGIRVCAVHPGLLATDSGPPDPDTSAEEGAERLAKWVLSAKGCVSGSYHELDTGRSQW